jgi:hypothetical protein
VTAPSAAAGTIALGASGSADIQTVSYELTPHGAATWTTIGTGSAPAPFTFSWNTAARADGVYDVRATATDGGGNTGSDHKTVTIDNTAATGAMTQPAASATVGGHAVALGASTNDAGGSGVAAVAFQYRAAGSAGAFTDIASGAWNAAAVSSGDYDVRAKITDNAGNVGFTATRRVTVDSTPPTLSLASLPALLSGTVTVDASVAGATSAILQVRGAGGWTTVGRVSTLPLTFAFDSSVVPDGSYDVRVVADDAFDNEAIDTRSGIRIDNTPPSIVSTAPADGSVLAVGTPLTSISLVASETLSAVNSVQVDGDPAPGSAVVSGSDGTITFTDLGPGSHYVTGTLVDTASKTRPFRVNVSVLGADGTIPPVMKNAPASNTTLSSTADSSATVRVPVGAYTQPAGHADDWLVLRVVPLPPAFTPMGGFETAGSILDVTMAWNSTGDELHQFDQPLEITLTDPTGGLAIPATNQNGKWRLIPALAGNALPATQADGFYRDPAGVHVLTHHLSQFTLVHDIALPAPPRDFAAVVASDGLTLRWAPGIDQNRIQNFVLYVDGQAYQTFGAQEFETKLGAFTADDTRSFAVAEINTSGISSAPTTPLLAVPTVAGQSVADATAALGARGFTVGKLVPVVSTAPAGTVVGPTAVQLLPAGSIVDLQVAANSVPRQAQFVLRIAVQKRVRLTSHALVARILSTAPARIAATLDGTHYRRIQRWSFKAPAGSSLHTLELRHTLQPGTYTLYWLGRSADGSVFRTTQKLRVIGATAKAHTANPAQIILTVGPATTKTVQRTIQAVGQTIEATPEQSFDLAATHDASVIIVDADKYGVKLVRDLRAVFPTTSIVALSKSPVTLDALARAGAIAVPSSTSPAKIAKLVQKLAGR